ncbi:DUF624 domain-containing protein [Corynebacterium guangdongense]|uniref:DUF624 domain-containing protein n=1 Tax=Corynebacterium guangdongense TaxID=1783348 RepID=A0ABU1ZYZ6_9CORY|nr:DUF624 domain-containing protein [Corynebacterium guangdongense]MDR7330159.1 hypothetical protein [Corynebacterium guangdongense]WJZ18717.1 hypothetical protein CGUA_10850 [Corynebacterium guangdongense]
MSRIFGIDTPFYRALALFADLVLVNLAMVVGALPLLTFGPAQRAAAGVTRGLVRGEGSRPVRSFLGLLPRGWAAATVWWLVSLGCGLLALYELIVIGRAVDGVTSVVLSALVLMGMGLVGGISVWFYPLLDARPAGVAPTLTAAALHSVRYPFRTLGGVALYAAPWVVLGVAPGQWSVLLGFYLIIGLGLTQYLLALLTAEVLHGAVDGD